MLDETVLESKDEIRLETEKEELDSTVEDMIEDVIVALTFAGAVDELLGGKEKLPGGFVKLNGGREKLPGGPVQFNAGSEKLPGAPGCVKLAGKVKFLG